MLCQLIQTTSAKERIKRAQIRDEIERLEIELAVATERFRELTIDNEQEIDMVGMEVAHKVFGKGQILSQTNGIQVIAFPNGEKKFQFPTAYTGGFLKADDSIMTALTAIATNKAEAEKANKSVHALSEQIAALRKTL